ERDVDLGRALRHDDLEDVHVLGPAGPRELLPAGAEEDPAEVVDRPGGPMIAGEELRVVQSQRAGRGWALQVGVHDATRDRREIDPHAHRLRRTSSRRGRRRETGGSDETAGAQMRPTTWVPARPSMASGRLSGFVMRARRPPAFKKWI